MSFVEDFSSVLSFTDIPQTISHFRTYVFRVSPSEGIRDSRFGPYFGNGIMDDLTQYAPL